MLGSFRPSLHYDRMLTWWKERAAEADDGTRMIFFLVHESEPGTKVKGVELRGVVMLDLWDCETAGRWATVQTLIVKPDFRRNGGATSLMALLEAEARRLGRLNLVSNPK